MDLGPLPSRTRLVHLVVGHCKETGPRRPVPRTHRSTAVSGGRGCARPSAGVVPPSRTSVFEESKGKVVLCQSSKPWSTDPRIGRHETRAGVGERTDLLSPPQLYAELPVGPRPRKESLGTSRGNRTSTRHDRNPHRAGERSRRLNRCVGEVLRNSVRVLRRVVTTVAPHRPAFSRTRCDDRPPVPGVHWSQARPRSLLSRPRPPSYSGGSR